MRYRVIFVADKLKSFNKKGLRASLFQIPVYMLPSQYRQVSTILRPPIIVNTPELSGRRGDSTNTSMSKMKVFKGFIIFSLIFLGTDLVYKTVNNITYLTREKCILYRVLPKYAFLVYEYFIELLMVVVVGIFLATLLKSYFSKYRRFYPKGTITAFLYASFIPLCACSAIPLIGSMKEKLRFRTIITFVVATPLLSPYIIMLSFSVLGIKYGILRIAGAFVLALSSGLVLEFFRSKELSAEPTMSNTYFSCSSQAAGNTCSIQACHLQKMDIYEETYVVFRKIVPFLIIAGIGGIVFEFLAPADFLVEHELPNNIIGIMLAILVGIPVYFCNGAEVLFLRPLVHASGFSPGIAIAFSLASTSICITSLAMLTKFIGKKLTSILLISVIITTFIIGLVVDMIVPVL